MRRFFNGDLTESDLFLDLTIEEQNFYFHSFFYSDDEGFIKNPKRVARIINIDYSVCEKLIAKGFYISFTSGVICITHWFLNNVIRKDRMKSTVFTEEKQFLVRAENGKYNVLRPNDNQMTTECQPNVTPIYIYNIIYNIIYTSINHIYCSDLKDKSEHEKSISETNVFSLPLIDGTEHYVLTEDYEKYILLYPNVDIMQELKNMYGWLDAHPKKQKTSKGINRFINNWLRNAQDRGEIITDQSKPNKRKIIAKWGDDN